MSTATAGSLSEYLNTSYRPDCDYLDGELLDRNVGEWDHSRLQMLLSQYLFAREKQLRCVWLINPRTRQTYIYTSAGIREVRDGVLTTENPDIRVVLAELE